MDEKLPVLWRLIFLFPVLLCMIMALMLVIQYTKL